MSKPTFDLHAELARVTNAYCEAHGLPVTPPMVPLMEFIEREDCVFVNQSDHVPLTKREIPESIKGDRVESDDSDDTRHNSPTHTPYNHNPRRPK